ncbi:putative gustatory receptor 2a [Anopheles funestus]|uniref:Gustatory receptor n=1 Tax=Anopheles funestus TaxID=62324 RepID=A0A182S582_ANOFN|nr:putative gustatory receptor 2a [Anopheles funestus]
MNIVLPLLPTRRQLLFVAFAMFKLFGFIPFPLDCHTFKPKSCSNTGTLFHLPILQVVLYAFINCMILKYRVQIFYTNLQILNINDILKFGSLMWAVLAIFICTIVQRNTHRCFWEMLKTIRGTTRKEYVQRFRTQYLWKFYGYLVFSSIVEVQVLYTIQDSPSEVVYWFVMLFLNVFLWMRHLFHILYIDLLKIHLQQLEYGLVEIRDYMDDLHVHPKESALYREMYERCINRLLKLKTVYGQLWELSDCINRTFGWSQIYSFSANFVQLSCDLYWCYMCIKGYSDGDLQSTLIELLPTSCLIGLLLNSAEACLRVTTALQSALLEIPHENDQTFRKIIYRFGLQIAQQRIRLTAYGLFDINYSLLKMFATGITTYMIIFITFSKEISLEEYDNN